MENYYLERDWLIKTKNDILNHLEIIPIDSSWRRAYENLVDSLDRLDAMTARIEVNITEIEKTMTPKEKGIELMTKFLAYSNKFHDNDTNDAKECALIAIDYLLWEIIKYADNSREYVVENSKYWQEVKEEIEKL